MQVSESVLTKLTCSHCRGYLSRGPVYVLENDKIRCGRCTIPEGARRVKAYEEVAELLLFPCLYKKNGCQEKVAFTENSSHEDTCAFRDYACPVAESKGCTWSGELGNILKHFQTAHPNNIVGNPLKFFQSITKSSLQNYLLFVFHVLFLIQIKVCLASRKIYYSVRIIGDSKNARKYNFSVNTENNGIKLTKTGNVAPLGSLTLPEDQSLTTSFNILKRLGDIKDIIFTVTVQSADQPEPEIPTTTTTGSNAAGNNVAEMNKKKTNGSQFMCVQCKFVTEPVYRDRKKGWLCRSCAPCRFPCKNICKGCMYLDTDDKREKHEEFYCPYSTRCQICKKNVKVPLDAHYTKAHSKITHPADAEFTVKFEFSENNWFIINTDFGNVVVQYYGYDTNFHVLVNTPLASQYLHLYNCIVEISNPVSGYDCARIDEARYNTSTDWYLVFRRTSSYVYRNRLNIKVKFIHKYKKPYDNVFQI